MLGDTNSLRRESFFTRVFGDRAFYKIVVSIVVPIIIQETISNVVNLLDNIMVGQIGTEEMSGTAISNQLLFVFMLCIYGGISAADIYGAQFYGAKDYKGLRDTMRYKLIISAIITIVALTIFLLFGSTLVSLFINDTGDALDVVLTYDSAMEYLYTMLWGIYPLALSICYAGTLRAAGKTTLPMIAGIISVLVNLLLNYILIFGHLGFPAMGVRGAAIATVISRFVQLGVIVTFSHVNKEKYFFLTGVYKTLRIPRELMRNINIKGAPLLINETLWSLGMATMTQLYSVRGLVVVSALNISNTISNLFNVFYLCMGNVVAVMVGQALGADDPALAKRTSSRLIVFSVCVSIVVGGALAAVSKFVPYVYNTTDQVRSLATMFLLIIAVLMPVFTYSHCCYFTLRSGGKTLVTFLFDSFFTWVFCVPVAYVLAHFTKLDIVMLYAICLGLDVFKCLIGGIMVKKGVWIQNIVKTMH